jgi:hypothetical protein
MPHTVRPSGRCVEYGRISPRKGKDAVALHLKVRNSWVPNQRVRAKPGWETAFEDAHFGWRIALNVKISTRRVARRSVGDHGE